MVTEAVLKRLDTFSSAGAAASAQQSRPDSRSPGAAAAAAAGRLLRHGFPPRPSRGRRPLRYSRDPLCEGVRRYGFHGLSYEYIADSLPSVAPEIAKGRVVVAHLGSGASMCAISCREERRKHHGLHRA